MFEKPETNHVRRFVFLIVCLNAFLFSFGSGSIQIKPEPGWLVPQILHNTRSPDSKEISNGYYYELMNRQVNLKNQTVYFHFIRQIVNESGVQVASEVSVNFAPACQQIIFHEVSVLRDGIRTNELGLSALKIEDNRSNTLDFEYDGMKRAYLILKDVRKGDQIDVSYSIVGFNPVFGGRFAEDFYFNRSTPVLNYNLCLITDSAKKIYIKTFNHAQLPTEHFSGAAKIYQWTDPELQIESGTSNTPSWFTDIPYVSVSEYANWKAVVDWGSGLFTQAAEPLPEKLIKQMDLWRKQASGDADMFANLALRFVQDQIRYLGLEIGSYTHQPHSPGTVFNQRYGDCKDKAMLLATILNSEHITSFVALTNTEDREMLQEANPSPLAFNHAIVAIKRGSGYVFVDPTMTMQRGELINSYLPAYAWALVIKPDQGELAKVDPGFENYINSVEEFNIQYDDSSTLDVVTDFKGGAADEVRNNLSSSSDREIAGSYQNFYVKLYDGIRPSKPLNITDDSLKNAYTIKEYYTIPSLWHKGETGKQAMNLYAKTISYKIPDPSGHAGSSPLALDFPLTEDYTMQLNLPEKFPMELNAVHVKNDSYQFDFTPQQYGTEQVLKYHFKTFRDFIPANEIEQYKKDYAEIEKCMSFNFWHGDIAAPVTDPSVNLHPGNLNWVNIWLCFFLGVSFTMLFRFLNKKTTEPGHRRDAGQQLGGWSMVLGISLIVRFIFQSYVFYTGQYLLRSTWEQAALTGGIGLQSIFISEMFESLFAIAGLGSLIYWFFGRRDIFPKMFIFFTTIFLGMQVLQLLIYTTTNLSITKSLEHRLEIEIFKTLIYSAIWCSYITRSERVKRTFIYPPDL